MTEYITPNGYINAQNDGREYIIPSGSYLNQPDPTAYTLTADSGTFTLSGTAANLLHGYKVPAGSGSFVLSGTAANLLHGYKVSAASGNFVLTGTAATLDYSGEGGESGSPPPPSLIAAFNADKEWSSCHWNIGTQQDVASDEIGTGTEDINAYWHPSRYDGLREWLQMRKDLGFKGVMLTTHYWEGFCLYPSPHGTRDVPHTNWAAAHPGVNVVSDFCTNARALGLKVGLYYNMEDLYYHTLVSPPVDFQTWCIDNISHILSNYGNIDLLFIDAWGDWWAGNNGISYSTVDFTAVMNAIRAAQPNCIVTINDHQNSGTPKGDFRLWERTGGEDTPEPPQGFTLFPALALHDTQHLEYGVGAGSARWFAHRNRGLDPLTHLSDGIARRFRCLYNGYVWFENDSPDDSGRPPRDTRNMVSELLYMPGATRVQDAFAAAAGTNINAYGANWSSSQNVIVSPTGHVRNVGGSSSSLVDYGGYLNAKRAELSFTFMSHDATDRYATLYFGNPLSGDYNAITVDIASGTITVTLDSVGSGNATVSKTVDNSAYAIIHAGSMHKLALERRGSLITGEFWTYLNGSYQVSHKIYLTNHSVQDYDTLFRLHSEGTDTTGIHVTNFTISDGRGESIMAADDISNLTLRYKFDETSGTQATDSSGNLYHGTYTGLAARVTGKVGTAAQFTGGFIDVPALLPVSDWSVMCWVRPTSLSGGLDALFVTDGFTFQALHIHFNNGVLDCFLNGSGGTTFGTSANWPLGVWTHLAVTSNLTTGIMSAYANGVSIGTPTAFLPNFGCAFIDSQIGLWNQPPTSRPFAGSVDDFRIYSRTLTQADVAQAMAVGRPARGNTILGIGCTI